MVLLELAQRANKLLRATAGPIDVVAQKDKLIPALEVLVKFSDWRREFTQPYQSFVSGFAGNFPNERIYRIAEWINLLRPSDFLGFYLPITVRVHDDFKRRSKGVTIHNRHLEGDLIMANSVDAQLDQCLTEGSSLMANSIRPTVNNSVVLSPYALWGAMPMSKEDFPHSVNYANWAPEQQRLFIKIENAVLERNIEGILKLLDDFGRSLTPGQRQNIRKHMGHNVKLIPMVLDEMYESLSDKTKSRLSRLKGSRRVMDAAHVVYDAFEKLARFGDTYHAKLRNFVGLGDVSLSYVKGGEIVDSIIAGRDIAKGAHLRVQNSYLVTPDGTRYIRDSTLGEPAAYQRIPLCTTDPNAVFTVINTFRSPAIKRFRQIRGH